MHFEQSIAKHGQMLANIGIFEAQGTLWVDSAASDAMKKSTWEVSLKMECQECPGQKLFIAIERSRIDNHLLSCKKKFHNEASVIAD